jgi:hypothetical protein
VELLHHLPRLLSASKLVQVVTTKAHQTTEIPNHGNVARQAQLLLGSNAAEVRIVAEMTIIPVILHLREVRLLGPEIVDVNQTTAVEATLITVALNRIMVTVLLHLGVLLLGSKLQPPPLLLDRHGMVLTQHLVTVLVTHLNLVWVLLPDLAVHQELHLDSALCLHSILVVPLHHHLVARLLPLHLGTLLLHHQVTNHHLLHQELRTTNLTLTPVDAAY